MEHNGISLPHKCGETVVADDAPKTESRQNNPFKMFNQPKEECSTITKACIRRFTEDSFPHVSPNYIPQIPLYIPTSQVRQTVPPTLLLLSKKQDLAHFLLL